MSRQPRIRGLLLLVVLSCPAASLAQTELPASPHTFVAPTARMLQPGHGYVSGYGLFVPSVQVGVTKRFSMGGGMMPPVGGIPPVWITPKVQLFDGQRTDVAAGVIHSFVGTEANVGLAYVVATRGDDDGSATFGASMAYARADGDGGQVPVFLLSGERRVSPRVRMMTENYYSPGIGGMLTVGFRVQGRSGSFDLGVAAPFARGGVFALMPILNWGYRF
jgi:hypothetical protein